MLITITITNGPSREELFDGLRLFAEKRAVPFTLEDKRKEILFTAYIIGIEVVDKKGEWWNLKLRIRKSFVALNHEDDYFDVHPFFNDKTNSRKFLPVDARFSTKKRKGVITFPEYI
jgi:hypothetical protein